MRPGGGFQCVRVTSSAAAGAHLRACSIEGENMPWWVDVAYVVGTIAVFIVFDLFGKWADKL
ncbi:hypothetical protein DF200_04505 [Bifidobacterium catulorum]|uniref:Uncharacterized protein n=1 Tax=Bifidobacterium catulorum TaxID=1630173 RepID=A0A2U2MT64_9BIFI|nr:hypothetical protein DF200_04505 [Bifidobacterium catulorum]